MVMTGKKRDKSISIAKAIGIILMVIGHVCVKSSIGVHFIYMFHMPLFFILSGYFFQEPKTFGRLKTFVWKRIKGLYWPSWKYSIIFLYLHNYLLSFNICRGEIYNIKDMLMNTVKITVTFMPTERVLVGFWFLKALFTSAVLVGAYCYLLHKFNLYKLRPFVVLAVLIACVYMAGLESRSGTLFGMLYGVLFYEFGHLLRTVESRFNYSFALTLVLAIAVLVVSLVYNNIGNTEMLNVDKSTVLPFALTSLMGGMMVLSVSHIWHEHVKAGNKLESLMCYVGDHTMIILALHYPLIVLYKYFNLWNFSVIEILIGIVVPLMIFYVLNFAKSQCVVILNSLRK